MLIIAGNLPPGTALPSIRALAQDLSCSVITTRRAYQDLEREGLIQTKQGKGTFVAEIGEHFAQSYRHDQVKESFRMSIQLARQFHMKNEEILKVVQDLLKEVESQNE